MLTWNAGEQVVGADIRDIKGPNIHGAPSPQTMLWILKSIDSYFKIFGFLGGS